MKLFGFVLITDFLTLILSFTYLLSVRPSIENKGIDYYLAFVRRFFLYGFIALIVISCVFIPVKIIASLLHFPFKYPGSLIHGPFSFIGIAGLFLLDGNERLSSVFTALTSALKFVWYCLPIVAVIFLFEGCVIYYTIDVANIFANKEYPSYGQQQIEQGGVTSVNIDPADSDHVFVMKKVKKNYDAQNLLQLRNECKIITELQEKCPVIHLYKPCEQECMHNTCNLKLEYAKGGDLYSLLSTEKLSSDKALNYIKQIVIAVQCLHEGGIYHRDIKPDNIMFLDEEKTQIVLIDMGLATKKKHDTIRVGTPDYMPPEMRSANIQQYKCETADLYSLGIVIKLINDCSTTDQSQTELFDLIYNKLCDFTPIKRMSLSDVLKHIEDFEKSKQEESKQGRKKRHSRQRKCKRRTCKRRTCLKKP